MIEYTKNFFHDWHSVLGINERNLDYIKRYNPESAIRIADNKILTKKLLEENGILTPKLLATISSYKTLEKFKFNKLPGSVVLKPRKGFGGQGIIVFFSKDKNGNWLKADKSKYSSYDLKNHISGILDGNFSLSKNKDISFFEDRVSTHPIFKRYTYKSVPDIRVIVFNKVPVMAMIRLGTKYSDGKANLHSGAIGVGIDISRGITTYGVQADRLIEYHPDFDTPLRGFQIPYWDKILSLAVNSQRIIGLGYVGVDIVIDRILGPMVMELNARPGLAIQIANNTGLKDRLIRVKGLKILSIQKGIQVGKDLFGGEVDEEIEEISGKQLIGFVENIILTNNKLRIKVKARNDTGALWSTLDIDIARKLGFGSLIDEFNIFKSNHLFTDVKSGRKIKTLANNLLPSQGKIYKIALVKQTSGFDLRMIIEIPFEMSGRRQVGRFTLVNRKQMLYPCIIGRKDLKKKFLIDPDKAFLAKN